MLREFREFAMKGNVVDLAIGVIIGSAFGKIIESLVNDIIMPVIGKIVGNIDFSNLFIALSSSVKSPGLAEARKEGAVLAWGNFVTVSVNFMIIAFVLFLIVKAMNAMKKADADAAAKMTVEPPSVPRSEVLLEQIRDLLAKK